MTNFLITGMGGDMAQCIAKIIKSEFSGSKIYGIDITDKSAAKLFCHHFELAPRANDKDYISYISSIMQKYNIQFFIPCTEHELRTLNQLDSDHPLWEKTIACSKNILSVCLDKLETFKFLNAHNIQAPWFTENIADIKSFPCIYKKKSSSGSRDIFKIASKEEASFIKNFSSHGLFQEYLEGDDKEYTCSIFQWDDGTFQTIQLLRTLTGGATSWARVVQIPEIDKLCREIAAAFKLNGSLNVQLRMTEKGPMIFEINPRFSSTVYMRHLMGYKDLVWSIKKALGQNLGTLTPVPAGTEAAKISEIAIL